MDGSVCLFMLYQRWISWSLV